MKLKQFLAGVLTGVMVVASVPVSGLEAAKAWAEETGTKTAERITPMTIEGAYHYHSIQDEIEVSSDAEFKETAQVSELADSGNSFALTRYNTGGMPIRSEMTANNNIYLKLDSAAELAKMIWWTTNPVRRTYNNGANVEDGTVLRYRLWVTKDSNLSSSSIADAEWLGGEVVKYDPDESKGQYKAREQEQLRLYHEVDITEVLEEEDLSSVTGVRIEVLNTAGKYSATEDFSDTKIAMSSVELYASGATEMLANVEASADFADDDSVADVMTKPITDNVVNEDQGSGWMDVDNTSDSKVESVSGAANSPKKTEYDDLKANNNIYFTLPDAEEKAIGRLTYLAGSIYGTIAECNIYTSDDDSIDTAVGKGPEDIEDWTKVYSNVQGEQLGKTEYQDASGQTAYLEGEDIEPWGSYVANPTGWENAHVAVFDEVQKARYVRIEIVRTENSASGQLSALTNKWISGRNVYIYEAKPAMNYGEVSEIDLDVDRPFMNTVLGRASVTNETSAYMNGNSWVWKDEAGNIVSGESTARAKASQYTIEVTLTVPKDVAIADDVKVNMTLLQGHNTDAATVELTKGNGLVVEPQSGNNLAKIIATYQMPMVEDTTNAWRELKDYYENTAKAIQEQGNLWIDNDPDLPDGYTPEAAELKYAKRAWNDFYNQCLKVASWTSTQTIPDLPDNNDKPTESDQPGVTEGPSGRRTLGEYTQAKTDLENLVKALGNALLAGRSEIENEVLGISIQKPTEDGVLEEATLKNKGTLESTNKSIKLTYRDGAEIGDDGYIYGTKGNGVAQALLEDEGNEIFDQTSDPFMIYFKLKMDQAPTTKQSIVGSFNGGYGVQFTVSGTSVRLLAYGQAAAGGWPETGMTLPANWFQEGVEHEIVVIYDNNSNLFELYADGVKATEKRAATGPLKPSGDGNNRNTFAIGFNPHCDSQQNTPGEAFTGGFKDFTMFVGNEEKGTEVPDYSQLESLGEGDDFSAKLADLLASAEPVLKMDPRTSKYDIYSTEWIGIEDKDPLHENTRIKVGDSVNKYMGYKVKVTVNAAYPYLLPSDEATLADNYKITTDGREVTPTLVAVDQDKTGVELLYEYDSIETHPKEALQQYRDNTLTNKFLTDGGVSVDRNANADGTRVYTVASWNAYEPVYRLEVLPLLSDRKRYDLDTLAKYGTALTNLQAAADGLQKAADTCECTIGEITGITGQVELSMGDQNTATFDLMTNEAMPDVTVTGNKDNCIKHKDTAADDLVRFEYSLLEEDDEAYVNTAEATIADNKLTVQKSGLVRVKLTAYYGDQSKETTLMISVTGTPASEAQVNALQKLINDTKAAYPNWAENEELKKALEDAEAAIADGQEPSVADVNAATTKINDVVNKIQAEQNKAQAIAKRDAAVRDAENNYLDKENEYTPESWATFMNAYNAAKAASDDDENLLTIATTLENAIKGLVKKSGTGTDPSNPNPPSTNPGGSTGTNPSPKPSTPTDSFKDGYQQTVGGMTYKVTKAASLEVTLVKGKNAKTVKVPATVKVGGKTCKVVAIAANAFKGSKKLVNVTIGKNVTAIAKKAFNNCAKLSKITFSGTKLPTMKKGAFTKTKAKPTIKVNKKLRKTTKAKNAVVKKMKAAGIKKITAKNIK